MLRINELKLPLDHAAEDLSAAICARLGIAPPALIRFQIFRRGNDARKKHAILLTYVVDCVVADEATVLARFADDQNVRPTPDLSYKFPVMAPEGYDGERPVVIGAGPCGLLAALILAQMGLKPIIIERGKAVRERTKDTWGLWRKSACSTRIQRAVRRRRRWHILGRQALQPDQGPAPSGAQGAGGICQGRCT
jgi:uncharacterized FAD-dependent dehydrogenase